MDRERRGLVDRTVNAMALFPVAADKPVSIRRHGWTWVTTGHDQRFDALGRRCYRTMALESGEPGDSIHVRGWLPPPRQRATRQPADPRDLKVRARELVHQAVKTGRLKKLPCNVCGAMYVEAHHPDYTKPLDVIWLCKAHHDDQHPRAIV